MAPTFVYTRASSESVHVSRLKTNMNTQSSIQESILSGNLTPVNNRALRKIRSAARASRSAKTNKRAVSIVRELSRTNTWLKLCLMESRR